MVSRERETETEGGTDRETEGVGVGREHDPSYMSEKNHNCPVVSTCAESLNSEIQMQVMNQFSKTAGRCITQHSTHNFRGNSQAPRLPRHPTKSP